MGKLFEIEAARNKRSPARVQRAMLIVDLIDVAERAQRAEERAFGDPERGEQFAQRRREALRLAREVAAEIAGEQ
ncbi:MAG TPA: hypothetical protein VHW01_06795 [Polyangiaceae bacterium]|jgi:hypothetical protein|nr:hypothetical protein [Polyangiaceae bacterium]